MTIKFGPLLACSTLLLCCGAAHAELEADWDSGLRVGLGSSSYLTVGGRLHLDYASIDDDITLMDGGFEVRRARISLRGRFGEDWRAAADWDEGAIPGWKNAYVQYRGIDKLIITGGNQLVPLGFAATSSSNSSTFMEYALPDALNSHFLVGLSAKTYGSNWTLTGGFYGDGLSDSDTRTSDGQSIAGRFTFAPIRSRNKVFHLGVSAELRELDDTSGARIRARPESLAGTRRLIDTGIINDASEIGTYGFEFASMLDNLILQGEYVSANVKRDLGPEVRLSGAYVQAGWFVSGGKYRYSRRSGNFRAPRIKGKTGAWEIAARYSTLDLEDRDITGGQQTNVTFGVNWYLNEQLRIMFNAVHAEAEPNRDGLDESVDILQIRFQAAI